MVQSIQKGNNMETIIRFANLHSDRDLNALHHDDNNHLWSVHFTCSSKRRLSEDME